MKMKYRYQHISFEKRDSRGGKAFYLCRNNKDDSVLGTVFYYPLWRKYVFEGGPGAVFGTSCLADVIDFMKQLENPEIET